MGKALPVLILSPFGNIADPLQPSDLAPLAKEATLQSLDVQIGTIVYYAQRRLSQIAQRVTADLSIAHGTGYGQQGSIPINVPVLHKITVIDAPPAGSVSIFFSNLFGDMWAVPVKTGDVFDGFMYETQLQLPFSNAAAPGASLVLLVQGW